MVVGEITQEEAFLSADRTSIYSEFTVSIAEVLKNSSPAALSPTSSITVTRGGGAVRFPSGKVLRTGFHGKPLPDKGHRYLIFATRDEEGDDFRLLTAYEVRDGRVFPLDGVDLNGNIVPQLAAHQKFSGEVEESFLSRVRAAVASPLPSTTSLRTAGTRTACLIDTHNRTRHSPGGRTAC